MHPASLIVYIYAVLVIVGGVIGFAKAGSRPSLIAGVLGGLVLLAAGYDINLPVSILGLPGALILIAMLLVFFTVRYLRGSPRAFMPGGLMAILSLLALVGVWVASHGI
ncbi:MAG: TMEM14 family protein [Armatimonadota bacterium]|nr:TMEM14 family protein [Armatimonadota bacterium]